MHAVDGVFKLKAYLYQPSGFFWGHVFHVLQDRAYPTLKNYPVFLIIIWFLCETTVAISANPFLKLETVGRH